MPGSLSYVHHCVASVYANMNDNKTQGACNCTTHKTTTLLPRMNFLEIQSKLQLASFYPEHPCTYHCVFADLMYTTYGLAIILDVG